MSSEQELGGLILQALNDLGECVAKAEGVQFTYVNDAFCRLVGYTREELLAMRSVDLVPADEREVMMQRALARAGKAKVNEPEETRLVHKDGHVIHIESSAQRLPGSAGVIAVMRDITARKLAEARAQAEASLNESLVRAQSDLGEGVAMVAANRFVHANTAFCRTLGYSLEGLIALPTANDIVPQDDRDATRDHYMRLMKGDGSSSEVRETTLLRQDGAQVPVEITARFLPGTPPRWVVLVRDLTARRQAEADARQHAVTRDLVRHMLRHVGMTIGRQGGAAFMREMGRNLAREVSAPDISGYLAAFAQTGLGRLQLDRQEGGRFHVSGDDLLERTATSSQPTCQLALGFLEAAAGRLAGTDSLGNEFRCQSMGAARCEFVVHPRATPRAEPTTLAH